MNREVNEVDLRNLQSVLIFDEHDNTLHPAVVFQVQLINLRP